MLGSLALSAPLREISRSNYVGSVHSTAILPVNGQHVLAVLSQRDGVRAHLRLHDPRLESLYQERLRGRPVGLVTHGSTVYACNYYNGKIETVGFTARGSRIVTSRWADCDVAALRDVRGLSWASTTAGPVLVLSHRGGLAVVTLRARGAPLMTLIARPGRRYIAATAPFRFNRDGNDDILAVDRTGIVLRIQQNGSSWEIAREMRIDDVGFEPRTILGRRGEFWVGGHTRGAGRLHRFSWRARRTHRVGPIVIEDKGGKLRPAASYNTGPGSVDTMSWCGRDLLAIGGKKNTRGWVALLDHQKALKVTSEWWLRGTQCTHVAGNPHRAGWSVYAATLEKNVAMARVAGDREFPRDWNPFRPDPKPEPNPTDPDVIPDPGNGSDANPDDGHTQPAPGAARSVAVVPTVTVDQRRNEDTELVLIAMNRTSRVTLRLIADSGRTLHTRTIRVRRDRRVRLSMAAELRQLGVPSFSGYLRLDGGSRGDLIVDAVQRTAGRGENLRVHWR